MVGHDERFGPPIRDIDGGRCAIAQPIGATGASPVRVMTARIDERAIVAAR